MKEVKVWERPKSVPVPTVWARYESKKPMPNGRFPKFRIQDFTEEWRDQVEDQMVKFFLRDEPLSKSLDVKSDPEAIEEYVVLIRTYLSGSLVLIAVVENLNELGDKNLPALAGCNITGIETKEQTPKKSRSEKTQKIFDGLEKLYNTGKPFEHYNVSEFLNAYGLSVNPAYRGHNLGCEILKARFPLCKAVGLKVTVTAFTAGASQRAAEKAGFEVLGEVVYADYKDKNGEVVFKMDEPKSMILMGYRIP